MDELNLLIHMLYKYMLQDVLKLEKIKVLEKKVSYGRGRGGQSKSCIKIRKNVQDNDLEKNIEKQRGRNTQISVFHRCGNY